MVHENGLSVFGLSFSPVKGPEGNIEYLIHVKAEENTEQFDRAEIDRVVSEAHRELDK